METRYLHVPRKKHPMRLHSTIGSASDQVLDSFGQHGAALDSFNSASIQLRVRFESASDQLFGHFGSFRPLQAWPWKLTGKHSIFRASNSNVAPAIATFKSPSAFNRQRALPSHAPKRSFRRAVSRCATAGSGQRGTRSDPIRAATAKLRYGRKPTPPPLLFLHPRLIQPRSKICIAPRPDRSKCRHAASARHACLPP